MPWKLLYSVARETCTQEPAEVSIGVLESVSREIGEHNSDTLTKFVVHTLFAITKRRQNIPDEVRAHVEAAREVTNGNLEQLLITLP